jgi:small-conductance mechanosensitive channel
MTDKQHMAHDADISHLLLMNIALLVNLTETTYKSPKILGSVLHALEVSASILRRRLLDMGVDAADIKNLRQVSLDYAAVVYEESGLGPGTRDATAQELARQTRQKAHGAADDNAFSEQQKQEAERKAREALDKILNNRKETP